MNVSRFVLIIAIIAAFSVLCSKLPDEVYMERGAEYAKQAEYDKAIGSYEKLADLYPRSPLRAEALYQAGLIYANRLQKFDEAIEKLTTVKTEYSSDKIASQCQFMIGFIYANMANDTTRARDAYNLFLQKYPNHKLRSSVEWELKYLGKDINEIDELKNLGQAVDNASAEK